MEDLAETIAQVAADLAVAQEGLEEIKGQVIDLEEKEEGLEEEIGRCMMQNVANVESSVRFHSDHQAASQCIVQIALKIITQTLAEAFPQEDRKARLKIRMASLKNNSNN